MRHLLFVCGPTATRVLVITERCLALVEDVLWMLDAGETDAGQIAKRLGVQTTSLDSILRRAGRIDLYMRMTTRPNTYRRAA